jgi:hypothetical protein
MSETFASLNARARRLIGDTASNVFTDLQIDEWINDAVKDLSLHFPRVITSDLATSLDVRVYDLPATFIAVYSVEYPQGADPPSFLARRSYLHDSFWKIDGYYDIVDTQTGDTLNQSKLYISAKPGAAETIRVIHQATHSALSDASDETTIEDRHLHLIAMFCRWKAWEELATTEGADPDPIKLLSATQEVNAYRAQRVYREALFRAKAAESHSAQAAWSMDKHDRVY